MSVLEQTQSVRWPENWPLETRQAFQHRAKTDSITLADTLLIIQERRGTLYMLDMARYVIEKWNLQADRLQAQSNEARDLVAKLLGDGR